MDTKVSYKDENGDWKELKQSNLDYKSGIYMIVNFRNDKRYIGSAVNLKERFKHHEYVLNKGIHCNKYLQRAWNKYGKINFAFLVVEYCAKDDLITREQYYIDISRSYGNCYNIRKKADSQLGLKHSKKSKEKIVKALMGNHNNDGRVIVYGRTHSQESKEKMSNAQKGNKYCLGRKLSQQTKEKISNSLIGRSLTTETKEKISISHLGLKHSTISKNKISTALKGKKKSDKHRESLKVAWKKRREKNGQ